MSSHTETSEIPALGEGYSHARKAYGLVSALLMAWELIGVQLQESPIANLKITLKSPQAAPYVLIVLIVYFGFRITIEWYQNDIRRRNLLASRVDFVAAHAIATAAILLYVFQTLSKIQIANVLPPNGFASFVGGMLVSITLGVFVEDRRRIRPWKKNWFLTGSSAVFALSWLVIFVLRLYSALRERDLSLVILSVSGLLAGFGCVTLLLWLVRRSISALK